MDNVSPIRTPAIRANLQAMQHAPATPVSPIDALLHDITSHEAGPVTAGHVSSGIFGAILDMLNLAMVVVDRNLHIRFANTAAEAALAGGTVLNRCGTQLRVTSPDASALADGIAAAGRGCPVKRSMIVKGMGQDAVATWFRPVDSSLQTSDGIWSRGLVAVIFRPLPTQPALSTSLLCKHFGLTPKEAEVLRHLSCGASVPDIVTIMKIKKSTVRTHLSQCFQKTGTRRQPDLVSLALSLTSPVLE